MIFTQEHEELRRTVRNFVDKEINPHVEQWEKDGRFPIHDIFKKAGDLGLLGISKREQFLKPAISGEMVRCIGVSEVGAGSDVAGLKTTAKKDGSDYVINGSKMWITNSPSADFICLLANTSDDKPHINKSLIMVPMNTPGITVSPHLDKLGMRSSETAQVFFDNVRVPQRYRIGHEGAGFMMQMLQFQEERLFGAANMIKGLEHCINDTIDYCKERKTFGN